MMLWVRHWNQFKDYYRYRDFVLLFFLVPLFRDENLRSFILMSRGEEGSVLSLDQKHIKSVFIPFSVGWHICVEKKILTSLLCAQEMWKRQELPNLCSVLWAHSEQLKGCHRGMDLSPSNFMSHFVPENEKPNGVSEQMTGLVLQAFWVWRKIYSCQWKSAKWFLWGSGWENSLWGTCRCYAQHLYTKQEKLAVKIWNLQYLVWMVFLSI